MKNILNKILQVTIFNQSEKSIIFNLQNFPISSSKIKLNNISTDLSTIKSSCYDLFFDYFPYQPQDQTTPNLLPPRTFLHSLNNPMYLLIENSQKETTEHCPYLDFIKNLKFYGTLKQKKDKSVYLEIENDFLIKLVSNSLSDNRIEKFNIFNINIISQEEYEKKEVFKISETDLNQKYEFSIKNFSSIKVDDDDYTNKILFLEIESKELEEFRYKSHLSPKINGYNFSIVLGLIKYFKLRKSYPKTKINNTFNAA
jgi:hypothetical protein